ncbi:BMP family lipoprotein [Halonatronum saccharophilum]|uniref:BMP family lipoprotein n=1 Tax=Halonatronum saccharophilum TaxID=150060 RepID=UPI000483B134|nr:BMP family ABC transporter substrate-binding protein [Halonatronum saccharophilum]
MKKTILMLLVLLMLTSLLVGCGGEEEVTTEEGLKVGIVLSSGGKGDMSFNDSALRGLERAKEDGLIADFQYMEPRETAEAERNLRFLASNNFDLVIGVGFMQEDDIALVSSEFPETKFAIIDAVVENDNVASLVFAEHEGSFLAGAFAALMTTRNELDGIKEDTVVGFLGGMDMPLIRKFELGYTSGVDYINEVKGTDVSYRVAYAGSSPAAFNDPATGQEIALSQYDAGADIIYHASGGTGGGLFRAAQSRGLYAIGVDSDQDWVASGNVLTSMQKRVDNSVYDTVLAITEDRFEAGIQVYGLESAGVALSPLDRVGVTVEEAYEMGNISEEDLARVKDMKEMIPQDIIDEIEEIREKIISGDIVVPDYMSQN